MSKRQKKASSDLGENDDVVSLPPSNARRDDSQIRQRAYEIFLERGDAPGDAVSDWLSAAAIGSRGGLTSVDQCDPPWPLTRRDGFHDGIRLQVHN
jgi:hypothetical protein